MDADSDAENQNISNESKKIGGSNNNIHSNEGQQGKPKRQMKTPFQLETLEKAYASETYPSESTRAELSEKLGLTDRQLQMWFCHRRLKDKKEKENPPKKMRKNVAVVMPESPVDDMRAGAEPASDYGSGSGSGSSPYLMELRNAVESSRDLMDDIPIVRRSYESQQSVMELRVIACVEAQLGEPLREDGPILGMEFDSLPPDAFGAPLASSEQQKQSGHPYENKVYDRHDTKPNKVIPRVLQEYQSLTEQPYFHGSPIDGSRARISFVHANEPSSRAHGVPGHVSRVRVLSQQDKPGHIFSSPNGGEDCLPPRDSTSNNRINAQSTSHPILGTEDSYLLSDGQTFNNDSELRMERKRKSDEARIAREAEANEIRIRKELERQDILRRKNEERMRKEMEKHERERKKEEERLMRERQREEERLLREQKREMERREKFLQKEYLRAEKRRLKEELRMEKQEAKRKVAIEKATARKMAKESMDLIEDEQLELMDLAVASKGVSSTIHLDIDTLQNLDSFRDSLCVFPPESVQLKKPFAIQPWSDSEKNIGNLLMVWRFFITFADVLGLWPFTLDEFVQAFHDYDSRLLGEIHIVLLKSIIKDIEDVARTPSTGLGMNQYCTANPEGGHPQIIEGAYAWGFDIRNWQRHLNPLTWPEIFRQLALSAGLGPKLKKRSSTTWRSLGDYREVKGCEDIVSTIRNGSAAENAFAWMREKGLLLPRRSRHKLTPGTVKFAAFHVLSLEGSKGLTVLELAEKIQKSGLRDLTTSKTPEASISVALTRDTKLFERIAPSTYCVRPAFRKDPADAEAILAVARKKIRMFENGFLGGEYADDVERDEDSECDVDEDPEVEDLATPASANKNIEQYDEANTCSVSGKDNICNDVAVSVQNEVDRVFSSFSINGSKDARCQSTTESAVEEIGAGHLNQENIEIDESKPGESWIQGLAEGDYSHLSVEERLNALVALIGVANEGNSIRAVLEDRLEAANALKKQMWAEAQLDKSRLKEENMTRLDFTPAVGIKAETNLASSMGEGSQSPLPAIFDNKNEASPSLAEDRKPMFGSQAVQNHLNDFPTDRTFAIQDPSMGLDNIATQQHGYASKRSRSQLKAYIAHMAEEMYVYRSLPLGQDRRRNRYWQFATSASRNDPCSGRIFVELNDGTWRLIDTIEAFDALLSSLDTRGTRESHLRIMLQKIETSFKEKVRRNLQGYDTLGLSGTTVKSEAAGVDVHPDFAGLDSPSSAVCGLKSDPLEISSSFRIELGRTEIEKKAVLERYQDFQQWMWKECFNSLSLCASKNEKTRCTQLLAICDVCLDSHLSEDARCPSGLFTFGAFDNSSKFSEHAIQCEEKRKLGLRDKHVSDSYLPLGTRLLKLLSAVIEAYIPPEALDASWTEEHRKTWGMKLNASSSAEEVLQILTILESGIKRSYLSSNFETTKELLSSSITSADPWSVPILPWIPKSTAAVALRLLELDASIMYVKPEKGEPYQDEEVTENLITSRLLPLKSKQVALKELDQDGLVKEENYSNLAGKRKNYRRGKGNRDHGWSRKYHRKTPSITVDAGRRKARENENLNHRQKQQGMRINVRGRRTVRKRADRTFRNDTFRGQMPQVVIPNSSSSILHGKLEEEEWGVDQGRMIHMEDAENSNSAEANSDDNAQAEEYEQGNWEVGFMGASNGWNREDTMEVSDEDEDGSRDDPVFAEEAADEDSEGNIEMSEPSDQNGIDDAMDDSAASEYSD